MSILSAITSLDSAINAEMTLLQSPLLSKIMLLITNIGSGIVLAMLSLVVFSFLAYRKRRRDAVMFALGMIGGTLFELIIKTLIQRERPANALLSTANQSFPSGHAMMATVFVAMMIYLFKDDIKAKLWKIIFVSACVALALLIGLSRVYFNVHWTSDVMAGFILGIGWFWLCLIAQKKAFISIKAT